MTTDLRAEAEHVIGVIDANLKKWRAWFPNERSEVEVPREELLALKHFAEIGLRTERPDDSEPATPEWWGTVTKFFPARIDIDRDGWLHCGSTVISRTPTRRQVRCLAEACGVELRQSLKK